MSKFYRVKKDSFMWLKGAILEHNGQDGYQAINDVWDATELLGNEYISTRIIEAKDNSEWFERVYEISILGKAKYLTKEKARAFHDGMYKERKR